MVIRQFIVNRRASDTCHTECEVDLRKHASCSRRFFFKKRCCIKQGSCHEEGKRDKEEELVAETHEHVNECWGRQVR